MIKINNIMLINHFKMKSINCNHMKIEIKDLPWAGVTPVANPGTLYRALFFNHHKIGNFNHLV